MNSFMNIVTPTEAQVAWAAGLFEGEGSMSASRDSDGWIRYIALNLTMARDQDVVEEFAIIVGGGSVNAYYYGPNKDKIKYQWQTGKISEVRRIFSLLNPWLGARREHIGLSLLEEYDLQRSKGRDPGDTRRYIRTVS